MNVLNTSSKTVALVGHSAAGKSACLAYMNVNSAADMDLALGIHKAPSLATVLSWLADTSRPPIVIVSNHEKMLKAIHAAKLSGEYANLFNRILFVYLCKPKERLKRHLSKPTAEGILRPFEHQEYTLNHYDHFHRLFTGLGHEIIDCSTASTADVAQRVREISLQTKEVNRG
ncbi:MAG: hypothetical protein WCP12_18185 [bacterium]